MIKPNRESLQILMHPAPLLRSAAAYLKGSLKSDLAAGLTVGVVALPQSMAYAIIAGVHPKYGLYAATIPAIVSSLFGSSRYLIGGPTNAISMLIFSAMADTFVAGVAVSQLPEGQRMQVIFALAILVGVIQALMGLARLGSLIHFISHSVVVGFTAGAGILIAFNQLKNLLGLHIDASAHFIDTVLFTVRGLGGTNPASLLIGALTLLLIPALRRISPKLPGPLLAIGLSAVLVKAFQLDLHGLRLVGEIPRALPPLSLPGLDPGLARALFMPAMAVAILGIIESLAIAKSLAVASGDRIDGNREFVGQGLANIAAGLFSAIPGSGSFTRSALNHAAGARTPMAGVLSGVVVLVTVLLFAPLARYIPIPSLAAILMLIAWAMVDREALKLSYRATRADRLVLLTTLAATLTLELEKAVFLGVLLSVVLFLKKVSHPQLARVVPSRRNLRFVPHVPGGRSCPQVSFFIIEGPLFFGAIDELEERLYAYGEKQRGRIFIVLMKRILCVDATGTHALKRFMERCRREGTPLIFVGPREAVLRTLQSSGLALELGPRGLVENPSEAITTAFEHYIDPQLCSGCTQRIFLECRPPAG